MEIANNEIDSGIQEEDAEVNEVDPYSKTTSIQQISAHPLGALSSGIQHDSECHNDFNSQLSSATSDYSSESSHAQQDSDSFQSANHPNTSTPQPSCNTDTSPPIHSERSNNANNFILPLSSNGNPSQVPSLPDEQLQSMPILNGPSEHIRSNQNTSTPQPSCNTDTSPPIHSERSNNANHSNLPLSSNRNLSQVPSLPDEQLRSMPILNGPSEHIRSNQNTSTPQPSCNTDTSPPIHSERSNNANNFILPLSTNGNLSQVPSLPDEQLQSMPILNGPSEHIRSNQNTSTPQPSCNIDTSPPINSERSNNANHSNLPLSSNRNPSQVPSLPDEQLQSRPILNGSSKRTRSNQNSSKKPDEHNSKQVVKKSYGRSFLQIFPKTKKNGEKSNSQPSSDTNLATSVLHIAYEELEEATNFFHKNNLLGKGGFGTVHKGKYRNTTMAIKVIRCEDVGAKESLNELLFLSKYRHNNILPLYGYCRREDGVTLCLVCQYMPNGSLSDRLRCLDGTPPLSWAQRIKIATGTAEGLQYLHKMSAVLVHGDIKSANILLDEHFDARIGDFGLAREGPQQQQDRIFGTRPYLPENYLKRKELLSPEIDTYSFGVVLFELATGLKAVGVYKPNTEQQTLRDYVHSHDTLMELIDPKGGRGSNFSLKLILSGINCTNKDAKRRPGMDAVFKKLLELKQQTKELEDHSNKPADNQNQYLSLKNDILTKDDLENVRNGKKVQTYDVFVLYADAPDDRACAEYIKNKLETEFQHRLKLCDQNRDLIKEHAYEEYFIITRLISDRCNMVLVILSEDFEKDSLLTSLFKYAQSIANEKKIIKVIPCISKREGLTTEYRSLFSLDYEHYGQTAEFWKKLHHSLTTPQRSLSKRETQPMASDGENSRTEGRLNCLFPFLRRSRRNRVHNTNNDIQPITLSTRL